MRVRLDRYEQANRSMVTRTRLLFVLGGVGLAVSAVGGFLGCGMIAFPDPGESGFWAHRIGILFLLFTCLLPGSLSALFITIGVRQRARFRHLGEIAAVARQASGYVSPEEIARGLGTSVPDAHKLLVDASTIGLIEDGPSPVTPMPPQSPYAATHQAGVAQAATPAGPTPAAITIAPGAVVGGTYRIEEPLGRGGMGAVFAARHMRTGRRYALKTILAGEHAGETAIRRFEREATAASAIGHPGIVQVHDFNVAPGGTFYLVMDLLEGETLARRIDRGGPMPWQNAQRIAIELSSALAAAHDHGLLHRDIKPSNIFLARAKGGAERSVLVDFGLVKSLDSSLAVTSTGAVLGTPMYMSPEQARGEPLDIRSDVYSLAAVVFELVTGAPPFLDRTMAAVYARLLQEPPPRASQSAKRTLPRALDDVLGRALAKDRNARFADARAFADALSRITEDAPATSRMVN